MGVGDAEIFEDALDGAVLAERAMQRIERDVGLQRGKHRADIATDVDAGDLIAFLLQCIGAGIPGRQRHRPFGGKPAQQYGHVLYRSCPCPSP